MRRGRLVGLFAWIASGVRSRMGVGRRWSGGVLAGRTGGAYDYLTNNFIADAARVISPGRVERLAVVDVSAEGILTPPPFKDDTMRGGMRRNRLLAKLATIHFPRFFSRPQGDRTPGWV